MNKDEYADFTETAAELVAANDAAPVASVRLTEAEREALAEALVWSDGPAWRECYVSAIASRVEQILTDRLAPSIPSQRGPSDEKVEL